MSTRLVQTQGVGIFQELIDLLKDTATSCNCAFLMEGAAELEAVVSNARRPFEVAFFGRMKTGKSSLINAYVGHSLAITGVEEATATINKLTYGSEERCRSFTVHWKERIPEAQNYPLESLKTDWNGKATEVLERIAQTAYLELYAPVKALREVHIIDTPGTGSAAVEHEDMAQQFISGRETDALVYVFPPVGRETDEEALASFRKGCVEDSSPYNSVAVLHKWDHIYWNNGGKWDEISSKAARMHRIMGRMVAEVVPVSAPLATAARSAPNHFWEHALEVCSAFEEEEDMTDELESDEDWNDDEARAALYWEAKVHGLPWSSFQVLVRHLYREQATSPEEARASIEKLSGIRKLEELLERRFFKRSTLLQQRKMRADARSVLLKIIAKLESHLKIVERESVYFQRLAAIPTGETAVPSDISAWLRQKVEDTHSQVAALRQRNIDIDRLRLRIRTELSNNEISLDLLPWLDEHPEMFPATETAMLKTLLIHGASAVSKDNEAFACFANLLEQAAALTMAPDMETRRCAEKLCRYLDSIAADIYPS